MSILNKDLLECLEAIKAELAECACEELGTPVASTDSKVPSEKSKEMVVKKGEIETDPEKNFVKDYLAKLEPKGKKGEKATKTEEKWIAKAVSKHKGLLHKKLGVPQGEKIPAAKLDKASHAGGKLSKEANLAKTLKKLHKK